MTPEASPPASECFTYDSDMVKYSIEWAQDESNLNIGAYISLLCNTALGRALGKHTAIGNGSGEPQGIVTAAGAGLTAATKTDLTWEEVDELSDKVQPAYLSAPEGRASMFRGFSQNTFNTGFVGYILNHVTLGKLRRLTVSDTDKRPVLQTANNDGRIRNLLANGYPYMVVDELDNYGGSKVPVLFGNFGMHVSRYCGGIRFFDFWDSNTAANLQRHALGYVRYDSRGILTGTNNAYVKLQMPA